MFDGCGDKRKFVESYNFHDDRVTDIFLFVRLFERPCILLKNRKQYYTVL